MKKGLLFSIVMAIGFIFTGLNGWGQTEIFNYAGGGSAPTNWTFTDNVSTNPIDKGTYWLVDAGSPSDIITTAVYDLSSYSLAELNLSVATFGSGTAYPAKIEISYDGGSSYTQIATTATPSSSTYITGGPIALNSVTNQVVIRISNNGSSGRGVRLRNLVLTASSSAANILVSTASLSGFSYVSGNGPSSDKSFTVEGSDLTANISIAPPADYEISIGTGGAFSATNPITLVKDGGGAVASTTIYTRLKAGLSAGDYNSEDISLTSGTAEKVVTCSGTVLEQEPTNNPTLFSATVDSWSEITVVWTDASPASDNYLIKGSSDSYTAIVDPVDGSAETNGLLIQNISAGVMTYQFTGLAPSTTYYFKIFPYNGTGSTINYKVDGTIPQDQATTSAPPPLPNVFFSEYIEGSSNNKAIEIYNGTGSSIDLSDYSVKLGSNGGLWGSPEVLSGSLAAGDVYVIYNASANAAIQAVGDISSGVTFFNGDDALGLFYTSILIDVIGIEGVDPGTGWDVAGVTNGTLDHTLIRKFSVSSGNTNWSASAGTNTTDSEWIVNNIDFIDDLGVPITSWTGITNSDWATTGNWDYSVPGADINARIPDVSANKSPLPIISGSATVLNLYMLTGSSLIISPTGNLTVTGTFTNSGTLTLQSDATGTASLIETSGVSANVERYLTAGRWHSVSSPITSTTANSFLGVYLIYYDEPTGTWPYIIEPTDPLYVGVGYSAWPPSSASTVTYTGTLNSGTTTLPISWSGDHWNSVGNPYPSAIDWGGLGWSKTDIDGACYVWDGTQYLSNVPATGLGNLPGGIIPAQQSFMVHVATSPLSTPVLSVSDAARVHGVDPYKSSKSTDVIKLMVYGNNYSDETFIALNSEATLAFDSQYDAYKLMGIDEAPQLYTMAQGENLSINSIPEISKGLSIPLKLKVGTFGIYEITLNEINGFENYPLYLEDLKEHKVVNLKNNSLYKCEASPLDDPMRFVLHFSYDDVPVSGEFSDNSEVLIVPVDKTILISSNQAITGLVKIYNLLGQELESQALNHVTSAKIPLNSKPGYYIVQVQSETGITSRKLFVE